jgi:ligand-binding SRPBCC domain-containing protein
VACHLEFEQWVPFPLDQVFAFFSNPENLPRIMPAGMATRLETLNRISPPNVVSEKAAGVGSTIVTSFRVVPFLPVRAQWVSRITEFEDNSYFADVQDKGPFKNWQHRHEFRSEVRTAVTGTLCRDIIDYDPGFGPLGAIGDALFIRRQMTGTFAQRQKRRPGLLG